LCALNRIFGFEPALAHSLIAAAGSASALFDMDRKELSILTGPYSRFRDNICRRELDRSLEELERLGEAGVSFIGVNEEDYPELLKECGDAPLGLYFRSGGPPAEVFNKRPMVAVVGTRDISPYGREWCRRIVGAMSKAKTRCCVVSGFAMGTDIIAQSAAVEGGLCTVGVLPTGIDDVYPQRHRPFAGTLLHSPGCALVTDYPPSTAPVAINFIRRNRIIAGMCSATILVESKARGGGMITARLATSYDRDLFVLPGRIDDPRSQGCNILIREKTAEIIQDPETLLCSLGLESEPVQRRTKKTEDELREELGRHFSSKDEVGPEELSMLVDIAALVARQRGITLEGIAAKMEISYPEASRLCALLESEGFISIDLLQGCSTAVRI